jgi:tryptophanase
MWDFSQLPPGCLDGGVSLFMLHEHLDSVFTDDSRLSEAAEWMHRMLPLAKELHNSNQRLGLAGPDIEKAAAGTIEATLRNMVAYRNQLQNRLVERFRDASAPEVRFHATCSS